MILGDFPQYLMETLKCCCSLHGCVIVFMLLTTVSTESTCEAPSSPQCFRRKTFVSVYICEWSMNTTESDVTYDLYFNETKFGSITKTLYQINEDRLIKYRPVNIWVEAHMGNSSCTSTRRSVILYHSVKYEAPQNINMIWIKNNLSLSWTAVEKYPALAEIRFRRNGDSAESWENRMINTTNEAFKYQVLVVNLLKQTAYQVQIRQRSSQAHNPLWSNWSPVVIVPAGSTCEAPSSPQCFRRKTLVSVYICEWSMNTTESDVTYDLYFNETKFGSITKTLYQINEERLIKYRPVNIWVEAHMGNSSCTSTRRSVILYHSVKYEAPQNINMIWIKNNLSLSWTAVEKYPALAEIRFRRNGDSAESWENRMINTTNEAFKYQVLVVNLLKQTAYQVQIRQRSNQARNPLWSDWSPVVIVPAELEQQPEVSITTKLVHGTRKVMLKWKPMPHAAAVTGVTYSLSDTQSSRGCPCKRGRHQPRSNKYTTYVSNTAVNISVIARNAAGNSPPAIIQVPAEPIADLKTCDKTLLDEKLNKHTCLELYEHQDGEPRPKNVITLTRMKNKQKRKQTQQSVKDYIRYLYFEHRCDDGKPHTVKTCLFYQKEGIPQREPQDFTSSSETHSSVDLSWKAIPPDDQRGFLTHYSLCSVKISSQDESKECHNISASVIKHRLDNLTPGAKYNITLAGVTQMGEGPSIELTINTLPQKHTNVLLWSLSLLIVFFLISTTCIYISKRLKNKIFPPVPTPVLSNFTSYQPESQEMLERKEEVDVLTLHQIHTEDKSVLEDAEETTVLRGEWDDGTDEDVEDERGDSRMSGGAGDECLSPDTTDQTPRRSKEGEMTELEQVDNEIAMLIYRNGLVFDVKTDSP